MRTTATIFRIRGVPVRAHASWLVIVGLITWSLSVGYFPAVLPDLSPVDHWLAGFVAALLLFVSVFLHELSHTLVALANGIPVGSITLHIFGGVSELRREPDRPGVEFAVAVVGPLTSLGLAGLLAAATAALAPPPSVRALLHYLIVVNLLVGVFNLVPGFPLDGGRLLRAVLWRVKGDLQRATRIATQAGSVVAFLLVGLGVFRAFSGEFLGGLWLVLIGLFLRQAAVGSYEQQELRRILGPLRVRDVMTSDVVQVGADVPVTRIVDDVFWRHHVSSLPVVDHDGRPIGILALAALKAQPREQWGPDVTAGQVMRALDDTLAVRPDESLWSALQSLSRNQLGRAVVLEHGKLVGYLSLKDVLHVVALGPARSRP